MIVVQDGQRRARVSVALRGKKFTHEELDDLAFEADGELEDGVAPVNHETRLRMKIAKI
ncbi:hypothetical protein [Bradyrhizobium sp.]|uniref:hypothetical protein n=1 Tax=Bradyrhizobium sp. TaxID=376 RepID=UPI002606ED54|nr:hypothetical protein [Bradyrhizobium sp.]